MTTSPRARLLELVTRMSLVRAHELSAFGVRWHHVQHLMRLGWVRRHARGTLALVDTTVPAWLLVAKLLPDGVLSLRTALEFHRIVLPDRRTVWIGRNQNARVASINGGPDVAYRRATPTRPSRARSPPASPKPTSAPSQNSCTSINT